ncbi:unnamed protein product, partial [Agarophyton chilense]
MHDPNSGYWALVAAEWEARVAAHLLWDAHDHFRIWYIPPMLRTIMRQIDLVPALGSGSNVQDLYPILDVTNNTQWDRVPVANQPAGEGSARDKSPGRYDSGSGNWVYYNPFEGVRISAAQARALIDSPRPMPVGHPTGFIYTDDYEYEPPVDLDDPALDNELPAPSGVLPVEPSAPFQPVRTTSAAAANASGGGSSAPPGWGVNTLAQAPVATPQADSVRQGLVNAGIPIPPGMTDVSQMLAFASAYH